MIISKTAARAAARYRRAEGISEEGTPEVKLTKIYSIGDEDGISEFNDGSLLFWTSGRGGFVIPGGLGVWPKDLGSVGMKERGEISDQGMPGDYEEESFGAWQELPDDIRQKAQGAFQSDKIGKYSLRSYFGDEVVV